MIKRLELTILSHSESNLPCDTEESTCFRQSFISSFCSPMSVIVTFPTPLIFANSVVLASRSSFFNRVSFCYDS